MCVKKVKDTLLRKEVGREIGFQMIYTIFREYFIMVTIMYLVKTK
jgi:hypothetical protein